MIDIGIRVRHFLKGRRSIVSRAKRKGISTRLADESGPKPSRGLWGVGLSVWHLPHDGQAVRGALGAAQEGIRGTGMVRGECRYLRSSQAIFHHSDA